MIDNLINEFNTIIKTTCIMPREDVFFLCCDKFVAFGRVRCFCLVIVKSNDGENRGLDSAFR